MWPEKLPRGSSAEESKESPMCVASVATQFLSGEVPSLKLSSPRKQESPEACGLQVSLKAEPKDECKSKVGDQFGSLLKLQGACLVRCSSPPPVSFTLLRSSLHRFVHHRSGEVRGAHLMPVLSALAVEGTARGPLR